MIIPTNGLKKLEGWLHILIHSQFTNTIIMENLVSIEKNHIYTCFFGVSYQQRCFDFNRLTDMARLLYRFRSNINF